MRLSIAFARSIFIAIPNERQVKSFADDLIMQRGGVSTSEPLQYEPFVYLMDQSHIILTDSGGIQEEAPALGKPVIVMRNITERPEALQVGTVKLVGPDFNRIVLECSALIDEKDRYNSMSQLHSPYGDGKSSNRIIKFLESKC
jgi:UDP-N-acetylglucosamine 2-epimerase (non-hydrolysing)